MIDYLDIAETLNLSVEDDILAAEILNKLVGERKSDKLIELLWVKIRDAPILLFGAGPSLDHDINGMIDYGLDNLCTLIAADGATQALLSNGIIPDIVVTDLDGDMQYILEANKAGSIMVVHAHGDNIDALKKYVPKLEMLVPTTQVCPFGKLYNFGGFTDGDRAAFLCTNFNARIIGLLGMDFGKEIGKYSGKYKDRDRKIKKLRIGKMLIEELASTHRIFNLTQASKSDIPKISMKEFSNLI